MLCGGSLRLQEGEGGVLKLREDIEMSRRSVGMRVNLGVSRPVHLLRGADGGNS